MKYNVVIISLKGTDNKDANIEQLIEISKELATAIAGDAGCESFEETEKTVKGYVQEGCLDESVLKEGLTPFPVEGIIAEYSIEKVEDKNWNEEWERSGFEPIIVDNRCVIHDTLHPIECKDMTDITIDAVQAFGTGTHETTQMIVSHILHGAAEDKDVLDCGCGSGILSIAAMKYGAKSVFAYDIDSWSVENTLHNAEINNIYGIDVTLGDAGVLQETDRRFDLVLANINRNILLADMPSFVSVMKEGAFLVMSGFYTEDVTKLKDKAETLGLKYDTSYTKNNWCCLVFKHV